MSKTLKWVIAIIVIIIVIAGVWCLVVGNSSSLSTTATSTESIKIGVVGTFTGVGSYYGQQETRGLQLAQEEINRSGGVNGRKIELITEDSQAAPDKSVSAMQKLINVDKAKYVIGDSWVSTTFAMVPVANELRVILISPVASLKSLSQEDMFFRTMPNTEVLMNKLADYAYNKMGSKKVAILSQRTPFGEEHTQYFKVAFEKLGGKVVAIENFDLMSKDVRSELTKAKEANPDTILNLHASGPSLGLLMKQARELGTNVKWISSFGAESAPLVKEYPNITNGLVYVYTFDTDSNNSTISNFVNQYQSKFGELPDFTAANSYDALKLLSKAIATGDDILNVKQQLLSTTNYAGGSGLISFDQNGDANRNIIVKEIKDGKFVKISD
ncbi:MAG: ABC transporter substrate-binding protein [Candidatus Paceibacterota bacterium]|jgi:branched-chain amino acid transport system substrate-binding protein